MPTLPPPAPLEELYTATDAARLLVMSPENVRRLTRRGVLHACAVTVSPLKPILLYRRADIDRLAAARARPHRHPIPTERKQATGTATTPPGTRTAPTRGAARTRRQ
jgi:hypothetical protein